MSHYTHMLVYLAVGVVGGLIGLKTRMPAGALLGTVLAVVGTKAVLGVSWPMPKYYNFFGQVVLGVLIASAYAPGMFRNLGGLLLPMLGSTAVLVLVGALLSLLFQRWGVLDLPTAYIATSPGGMSALVPLAMDVQVNAATIAAFHFVRILFVLATAPLVYRIVLR